MKPIQLDRSYRPTKWQTPPGYEFYGNSSDTRSRRRARKGYSVFGCGVYRMCDLIALPVTYPGDEGISGFSVFVRKSAVNQSPRRENDGWTQGSWRYRKTEAKRERRKAKGVTPWK